MSRGDIPIPIDPASRPMTIQGRRMPSRDDVRSLILPKNGLLTIARKAPTPATRERLCGARSIPTSELTFNANVTSNGARNNRQVPLYASAYNTTNPSGPAGQRTTRQPTPPPFGTDHGQPQSRLRFHPPSQGQSAVSDRRTPRSPPSNYAW